MEEILKKPVYLVSGKYSFNKSVSKNLLNEPIDINFYIESKKEIKNVETFGDILYLAKTEPELFSGKLTLRINSRSEEAVNFARKIAKNYKCEIQIAEFAGLDVSTLLLLDKEYVYFKNEFINRSSGINEENLTFVTAFAKIYKEFDDFYFQMKTLTEILKDKMKIEKSNCEVSVYGEEIFSAMQETLDTRAVAIKLNNTETDKNENFEAVFTPKYFKLLKNGKITKIYFFETSDYFFENNFSYNFDKNKIELKFYNFKENSIISILKIKDSLLVEKVEGKNNFLKSFTIFGKESLSTLQDINQIEILEIIENIIKKINMFPEIDLKKEILDIFSYFQNEILKKEEELKNTREKYIEKRDLFLKKMFEEEE